MQGMIDLSSIQINSAYDIGLLALNGNSNSNGNSNNNGSNDTINYKENASLWYSPTFYSNNNVPLITIDNVTSNTNTHTNINTNTNTNTSELSINNFT